VSTQRVKYIRSLEAIEQLSAAEKAELRAVAERYVFRANDYYLGLIDWDDPNDPIRRLIIPVVEELDDWGELDASNEAAITVAPGVQHKYDQTVVLLCNEVCGAYCRYCFRKRLFMDENEEVSKDVSAGIEYIRRHPQVTDVLLSGGDPLIMSTRRLTEVIAQLGEIPHLRVIRIGTKMPAFNPWRVLDDTQLQAFFRQFNATTDKRIYIVSHFDHPRELTQPARDGILCLIDNGCWVVNQCPLIAGINDDPDVLAELFQECTSAGCPQYYLFQCRPTAGNAPYSVPIVRGRAILDEALTKVSGLSRRIRYAMSHATGKIEFVGVDDRYIYARYHQAKDPDDINRVMVFLRDAKARWFEDLIPVVQAAAPVTNGHRPRRKPVGTPLTVRRNRASWVT
jgi:lysine 2,3-aminomutase